MPARLSVIVSQIADLTIATVALSLLLRALRGSRARLTFAGVLIIGLVDLAARQIGLPLTAWLFRGLFFASVVVLLLAFQEDLKRFSERLAVWGLGQAPPTPSDDAVECVVRAAFALATVRRGALVVLPGREPLDRHLDGGIRLEGIVSEVLLRSLFDPHSPGHDGAVVVEGDRVVRFGAHLPLSANFAQLGSRGTRHAAALGLSEQSDAIVMVVSEERGTVSVAEGGNLSVVPNIDALRSRLSRFLAETRVRPVQPPRTLQGAVRRAAQWGAAFALAVALWILVVAGSEVGDRSVRVPVKVTNLPPGHTLRVVHPEAVDVHLAGARRRLFLMQPSDVTVTVDAILAPLGRRTFDVTPRQVAAPPGLTVVDIEPDQVVLDLETAPSRATGEVRSREPGRGTGGSGPGVDPAAGGSVRGGLSGANRGLSGPARK